jgi:hypothetical protein
MVIETLLVTLNSRALDAMFDEQKTFDIVEAVKRVPSLRVVEGDPSYSVVVTIESRHVDALRQAVDGFCVVGKDDIFDLY